MPGAVRQPPVGGLLSSGGRERVLVHRRLHLRERVVGLSRPRDPGTLRRSRRPRTSCSATMRSASASAVRDQAVGAARSPGACRGSRGPSLDRPRVSHGSRRAPPTGALYVYLAPLGVGSLKQPATSVRGSSPASKVGASRRGLPMLARDRSRHGACRASDGRTRDGSPVRAPLEQKRDRS